VVWSLLSTGIVNFHKLRLGRLGSEGGFTMIEAIVGIAVLGIGVATTVGALTHFNSLASVSRNSSGAYTAVMNQIDLFQSMSPFNPQKMNDKTDCDGLIHSQIPKDFCNNPPTYDMTLGTHTYNNIPVYQYKDPITGTVVVVQGTITVVVTDLSATIANTYQAVVTINYTFRNRNYSFSMSAIRSADV
jgi:type II secretory pathway pseudopilin PulG